MHTSKLLQIDCESSVINDFLTTLELYLENLLVNDYPALLNLLYKVDINEKRARNAFGGDVKQVAKNLALLIWERQLQKAESRLKYSK